MSARSERRAQRRAQARILTPPEGVPLDFEIAGVGVRVGAQFLDILITVVGLICLMILLAWLDLTTPQTLVAIGSLLFFVIRIPYYVLSELVWNGQTLGKRLLKIKVVSHDGGPLRTHSIVLRNLMKEAEVFLPGTLLLSLDTQSPVASVLAFAWVIMALWIPLGNVHRRRLGDIMAGTHVIHMPVPVLLPDLAGQADVARTPQGAAKYRFQSHQLDHYGAFELQTLETFLRAAETGRGTANQIKTLAAIVEKIRLKISFAAPVPPVERIAFLRSFYNAQRAHLEQRQLFGERRDDKHHANAPPQTDSPPAKP